MIVNYKQRAFDVRLLHLSNRSFSINTSIAALELPHAGTGSDSQASLLNVLQHREECLLLNATFGAT